MQSTRIYKEFEQLNNNEKELYAKGFKLAYNLLQIKEKNKNVHDLISTIFNYSSKSTSTIHIDKNDDRIEKSNNLLKRKNKELLQKFETIIRICPPQKKNYLVHSLKEYLLYDKKYNDSFSLLKNLKNDIKENKSSNVWVNQMKYIKVVNYYKQKLQIAHDRLHKIISSMNNETNNIKTINEVNIKTNINKKKIIKTVSFKDKSDITDLNNEEEVVMAEEVVQEQEPVHEKVVKVEESVKEQEPVHEEEVHEEKQEPVQEEEHVVPVQEEIVKVEESVQEEPVQEEVSKVEEEVQEQEHVEPIHEEVSKVEEEVHEEKQEPVQEEVVEVEEEVQEQEHVEPIHEEIVKVEEEPTTKKKDSDETKPKKARKPRKKKEDGEEKKPKKTRKPRNKKEEVKTEDN